MKVNIVFSSATQGEGKFLLKKSIENFLDMKGVRYSSTEHCIGVETDCLDPLSIPASVSTIYNDDTPMPFGVYAGTPLFQVPASHFHWLWTQRPVCDPLLEAYIKTNLPALRTEHPDGIWT